MKTLIITLFTALTLATGIAKTTNPTGTNHQTAVVLAGLSAINKIEVYGNVELFISDGASDEVKVYNKYYSESALVQSKNGVLRISSYKAEKLVVWVKANDLRSITAYDNAEVKSFGDLSKIELDVELHNNATAKLSLEVYSANVTVNDQAKASLSGNVTECGLKFNNAENVNCNNLVTEHSSKTLTQVVAATKVKTDDLADL